jgi:hypothetical protein
MTLPKLSLWLQSALLASALALMLWHVFLYIVYAVELMRFPFDYDQGEGFELLDAVYISEGKLPYQNNEVFPFYGSNYPPVYRVLLAPFVWGFGPEYWYGRLVSTLGTFITATLISYAIYRAEKRRGLAVLMGLAFLASNYIYHIGPLLRQHYFMVMFETLAVVWLSVLFDLPPEKRRGRWLSGLLILLVAGYTKQLAVVTVAAFFLWAFLRQPRTALIYALGFAGTTGAVFLLLNLATEGQWAINTVGANVNELNIGQFLALLRQYTRLHWALMLPALLLILYETYFTRFSLYSVWAGVAMASTVGSGAWGAGNSYFATSLVATCILAGIFISRTLNGAWTFPTNYLTRSVGRLPWPRGGPFLQEGLRVACMGLLVVYGLSVMKMPTSGPFFEPLSQALGVRPKPGHRYPFYDAAGWTQGYATIGHLPSRQDHENGWLIVERIRASEKPVMSEEAGFSLQAGRQVITNPTQLLNLYNNGLLDPSALVRMIENQDFGLIIFRARFYPAPVLAAVDDAYAPREVIPMNGFDYQLWYPEPTWETRRALRNYLEAPGLVPFEQNLPLRPTKPQQWLDEALGRWAWSWRAESAPLPGDCVGGLYERRGLTTHVRLCAETLSATPPE